MADENIKQVMQDAILDADSLERFINGSDSETVLTRLSAEYPTLQNAIKQMFENGGIAGRFKTLTALQASSLTDGSYALVADDVDEKNGIYIKENGVWVKSKYNQKSIDGLDVLLDKLKELIFFAYDESHFTVADGINNSTPKIPTYGMAVGFARSLMTQATRQPVITGYDRNGKSEVLFYRHRNATGELFFEFAIPSHITHITAKSVSPEQQGYRENYKPFVILGGSSEQVRHEVESILDSEEKTISFPNPHLGSFAYTTYDSTDKYAVLKGTILNYSVNTTGDSLEFIDGYGGARNRHTINQGTYIAPNDGVIYLNTLNDTHRSFNPDFEPFYEFIQPSKADEQGKSEVDVLESAKVAGEYLPTPHLKTVREVTFLDGTDKKAMQYLWYDADWNFYISSSKRGDRKLIFKYDAEVFKGREPHQVAMGFDKFGNIVCVFKVEHLSYRMSNDSRENPIILIKDEGYKPVVVDFGDKVKPCGWIQNSGFLCTDDAIHIAEYTRPAVPTAMCWKATYPLTDASNWTVVQEFEIHQTDIQNYVKHMHCIDRDPYTGFIYTGTGDSNIGSSVYVSKDGGDTFEVVINQNIKYARTLNWIFTKDYIYWAADNIGTYHGFYRTPRLPDGTMDYANIEDLVIFPEGGRTPATYATIYMRKINAMVFLHRTDGGAASVPVDVWDFEKGELVRIAEIATVDGLNRMVGFRCDTHEYYPRGNELICGFSETLGSHTYRNNMALLGNTADGHRVNNLIITIDRVGDGFTISYDTVI